MFSLRLSRRWSSRPFGVTVREFSEPAHKPVVLLRGEPADYAAIGRHVLMRMLFDMHLVRAFEEECVTAAAAGRITGPLHTCIGQEGIPAAVLRHLRPGDEVVGSHRSHHHFLVQSLARTLGSGFRPLESPVPPAARAAVTSLFAELMGKPTGVNHGVGGSMHLRDAAAGFMGSSAVVGGGVPIAAGLAFAHALRGTGGCAVCFLGDGAVNQGVFHETANLAGVLRLPLLLVVENNGYAEATRPEEVTAALPLAARGALHGLDSYRTEGGDLAALDRAAAACVAELRNGRPALIEVETYRHLDHVGGAPGSAAGYRTTAEEATWLARDPLHTLPGTLTDLGLLLPGEDKELAWAAAALVAEAYRAAEGDTAGDIPRLDAYRLLRAPEPAAAPAPDGPAPSAPGNTLSFRHAIARGLAAALRRLPDTVLLGEEVAKPGGLLHQAGCLDTDLVGTRIIDTPISEAAFTGLAGGAAMAGLRPMVELMYGSFALTAADQLFNHIGVIRALYGNTARAPVIVRAKVPVGQGYGPQHGVNPVGLFCSFPGWRVFAPADPRDYLGVLNSALECDDPVLLVEFSPLYDEAHELTDADFTARLPLRGAREVRRGSDVTVITYGLGVRWAREAAEELAREGCSAGILDLRALDAVAMDWETMARMLARTGRAVFVDPAPRGQAIAPRIMGELAARLPSVPRMSLLTCAEVQPAAPVLERQAVIGPPHVADAVRRLMREDGRTTTLGTGPFRPARARTPPPHHPRE